jgi:hypothetical protein
VQNGEICALCNHTAAEMHKMLVTAYGSDAATKSRVFMLNAFFDMKEIVYTEFFPG